MLALHSAVCANDILEVERLVQENPACVRETDEHSDTALHHAADQHSNESARILLQNQADPNAKNAAGQTPLYWAFDSPFDGGDAMIRLLVENGAETTIRLSGGQSPLHWAIQEGHEDLALFLVDKGVETNSEDDAGHTPLYWAIIKRRKEVARRLLDMGGIADVNIAPVLNEGLPIHKAIREDDTDTIELLLEAGSVADDGALAMAMCGSYNSAYLYVTELILKKGHVSIGDGLHWAAEQGDEDLARLLLRYIAEVNAKDPSRDNQTPLHLAAGLNAEEYGDPEPTVRLLLAHKADLRLTDNFGRTALDRAARRGNISIAKILIAAGANYSDELLVAAARADDFDLFQQCLQNGCSVQAVDGKGATALHYAALNGNLEMARMLGTHNADPNARDNEKNTPLHYAARGHFDAEDYEGAYTGGAAVAKYLLLAGKALVEPRNDAGLTPMDVALNRPSPYDQMAKLLRYFGATPDWEFLKAHDRDRWFRELSTEGRIYLCAEQKQTHEALPVAEVNVTKPKPEIANAQTKTNTEL